jgi:hypothetical protein
VGPSVGAPVTKQAGLNTKEVCMDSQHIPEIRNITVQGLENKDDHEFDGEASFNTQMVRVLKL